jgi:hypothetical protein
MWALCQCGCVIGNKVTIGQKPSAEALEFLKLPDASRQEVITTLGKPYFESETNRILVYIWEETLEIYPLVEGDPTTVSQPSNDSHENHHLGKQNANPAKPDDGWKDLREAGAETARVVAREIFLKPKSPAYGGSDSFSLGKPERWGLFIAYDENGKVTAHTGWKTEIDQSILEKKCANWRRNGTKINSSFEFTQIEPPPPPQTRR